MKKVMILAAETAIVSLCLYACNRDDEDVIEQKTTGTAFFGDTLILGIKGGVLPPEGDEGELKGK